MIITLSPKEYEFAAYAGFMRRIESLQDRYAERTGADQDTVYDNDILGAVAECVLAKAVQTYWGGPGHFNLPDVAGLQVRATTRMEGKLLIRPSDKDSEIFILVTGRYLHYKIPGWYYGVDAKQPEWLYMGNGRNPCYMVPQANLYPFESLLAAPPVK